MQVVVQVMEDEMGQLSPVLLQWWEVVFIEWEHTLHGEVYYLCWATSCQKV